MSRQNTKEWGRYWVDPEGVNRGRLVFLREALGKFDWGVLRLKSPVKSNQVSFFFFFLMFFKNVEYSDPKKGRRSGGKIHTSYNHSA